MSINTIAIARRLRDTDMSAAQAEVIAEEIGLAVLEGAATKADIQLVRSDLAQLKTELESRVDTKVEQLRSTMMLWFIGTNLTLAAIVIAALKL